MQTLKPIIPILMALCPFFLESQSIYTYPLSSGFSSVQAGGPDLIQIPNNSGAYGEFTTRIVPASTCGQGGTAGGYFFEDDAGLQFNSPEGFIDQRYSLALNFQIDEFISPPGWVRLLSFTHFDDVGMYIKLTNPPSNGTLEFWPYGTAGEWDFFNTTDFYQMIIVRNASGVITVYINGVEFATYDDSGTQAFVPADPDNFIVFFRDDPSVLANEASPGFVSSIIIRNLEWNAQEVQAVWENFCSSLLSIPEETNEVVHLFPNPSNDGFIHIQVPAGMENSMFTIYDLQGRPIIAGQLDDEDDALDIRNLAPGIYMVSLKKGNSLKTMRFVKQ